MVDGLFQRHVVDALLHTPIAHTSAQCLAYAAHLQQHSSACLQALKKPSSSHTLWLFVDSFLSTAPRPLELRSFTTHTTHTTHTHSLHVLHRCFQRLKQLVLQVVDELRFAHDIDAAMLIDICALYNTSNNDTVQRIVRACVQHDTLKKAIVDSIDFALTILHDITFNSQALLMFVSALRSVFLVYSPAIFLARDAELLKILVLIFDSTLHYDNDEMLCEETFALTSMLLFDGYFASIVEHAHNDDEEHVLERFGADLPLLALGYDDNDGVCGGRRVCVGSLLYCLNVVHNIRERVVNCTLDSTLRDYILGVFDECLLSLPSSSTHTLSKSLQTRANEFSTTVSNQHDELVKSLQELCGDISSDFAFACLAEHNFNFENTVNAVFEQTLPDYLQRVKRRNNWIDRRRKNLQTTKTKSTLPTANAVHQTSIPVDVIEEYAQLSGRITIDEARRREEDRIREEESVLMPNTNDIQMLRDTMVLDGYDDEEDDSFDGYVPFTPLTSGVEDETIVDGETTVAEQSTVYKHDGQQDDDDDDGGGGTRGGRGGSSARSVRGGRGGRGKPKTTADETRRYHKNERNKAAKANHHRKSRAAHKRAL